MSESIKNWINLFLFSTIVFGILFIMFRTDWLDYRLVKKEEVPTKIEPEIQPKIIQQEKETTPEPFEQFFNSHRIAIYPDGLVTPETLISACENPSGRGVKDQTQCNKEIAKITRILEVSKKPTSGWLYVKASVSRGKAPLGALNKDYDAIWIFLKDGLHGGNLFQKDAISRISEDGTTELLYRLNKIIVVGLPYSETNPINRRELNFTEVLIPGKHYVAAFVSSLGYGKIQALEIGLEDGNIKLAQ